MMIRQLRFAPYQLRFKHPWVSRHGSRTVREGLLITLVDEDGLQAVGEAAPLAEMGSETLSQCQQQLESLQSRIQRFTPETLLEWLEPQRHPYPALCCGLESAAIGVLAQRQQCSLAAWLNPDHGHQLRLNQTLPAIDPQQLDPTWQQQEGAVFKVKVGITAMAEEIAALQRLAAALRPTQSLRLDANQAWQFDEASTFIASLRGLPIESLEEPLATPQLQTIARLQRHTPFPLALDESIRSLGIDAILLQGGIRRVVLKPTLLGGPWQSCKIAQRCLDHGIEVVITSTLEGGVGLQAVAACAAAVDPQQRQHHGLATAQLFQPPPPLAVEIKNGILHLP
jgi:o-succinylbenzoate synthase